MRILVTGATGLVGRGVVADIVAHGDEAIVLTRNPERARSSLPGLTAVYRWNPLAGPPPARAVEDVDAVVHLLGEPVAGRWTPAKKQAIRDSRVVSTRHLVSGLRNVNSKSCVLVSASAMGYYGNRGDHVLTEESISGEGFLAQVCSDWEAEAKLAGAYGLQVTLLRSSNVLAPTGGMLGPLVRLFRFGLGGPMASGSQWWPWVHIDDEVGLIRLALERRVTGVVNATSPNPVRQADFARAIGLAVRRPALLPAPSWALRLVLGELAVEILSSQRMVPRAALDAGYRFRFPDLPAALRDVLGA